MSQRDTQRVGRELERVQSSFRTFADQLPGAVFRYVVRADGTDGVLYMSRGCYQLWEVEASEIVEDASLLWQQVDPEDLPAMQDSVMRSAQTLRPWQHEWRITTPSGKRKWLEGRGLPHRTESGDIEWHSIILDVTDRVEQRLEKERLERQLSQASRMESVGRLAGGVAHDFNNMLTVILSGVDLWEHEEDDEARREALVAIRTAALRSRDLTTRLLAFAGSREQKSKTLDLGPHLAGLLPLLSRMVGDGIKIELREGVYPCGLPIGSSDVDQIVTNLVINAADAMNGRGTIWVSWRLDEASHQCVLSVLDDGPGIPEDVLPHIFEPFFSTKDQSQNTGLGLATVYALCRRHGGFVEARSSPGEGTCFEVRLPLTSEGSGHTTQPSAPETISSGKQLKVLVVEDEAGVRLVLSRLLLLLGHQVTAFDSPLAALETFREDPNAHDIALVDISMPEMDGWTLIAQLTSLRPSLPCVGMSGFAAQAPESLREVPLLGKPFEAEKLEALLLHHTLA